VRDKKLISEILELTVRNGRVDHPPGGHDDHVIAWLMTHWLLTFGHNLSEYGIPNGYALSAMKTDGREVNEEVMEERRVQEELMEQIEIVTTALEIVVMKCFSLSWSISSKLCCHGCPLSRVNISAWMISCVHLRRSERNVSWKR